MFRRSFLKAALGVVSLPVMPHLLGAALGGALRFMRPHMPEWTASYEKKWLWTAKQDGDIFMDWGGTVGRDGDIVIDWARWTKRR